MQATADVIQLPQRVKSGKMPVRLAYAFSRSREFLFKAEIDKVERAAKKTGRHGHRDGTLIMTGFRHGLRISELANLKWSQVDLEQGRIHIKRKKGSNDTVHALEGGEIRAFRKLKRDYPLTDYIFVSERGSSMTSSTIQKMVKRAGEVAGLSFRIHPHMLKHSCGFYLANDLKMDALAIKEYLGHVDIKNTLVYIRLATNRDDISFE